MVRRLLLLMGLAVLGVVINHAIGLTYVSMFWWTDRYAQVSVPNFDALGGLSYTAMRVLEQAIMFAIPAFLLVSGFFIAVATGRTKKTVAWRTVLSRIGTLLTPYLLWSFIMFAGSYVQGDRYSLVEYVRLLVIGGAATAYYYVPVVIQLYLLSPALVPLAKKRWKLLLAVTAIVQFGVIVLQYPSLLGVDTKGLQVAYLLTRSWLFVGYIFWFCLGLAFGFHMQTIGAWVTRNRWALLTAAFVLIVVGVVEWEAIVRASPEGWVGQKRTVVDELYSFAVMLAFLGFTGLRIPWAKQLGDLGTKSYGIYLSHVVFLEWVPKLAYHFVPGLMAFPWPFMLSLVVVGLAGPLALMWSVRHTPLDRYYRYIFG